MINKAVLERKRYWKDKGKRREARPNNNEQEDSD
jgi:hypothetical protein